MKITIPALPILLLVGCGSISERVIHADKPPRGLYEGTAFDAALIASPFRRCSGPECGFLADSLLFEVPACVLGVVSMPVSLTVDTLMLPIDAYKIKSRETRN